MLSEECTNAIVFRRSVAFRKIREAKPVPVFVVHHFAEKRLVASDVGFEVFERILVEVHVGPGVVAEGIAGGTPSLEHGKILGLAFERCAVHETVSWRNMSVAERGENFCRDFGASFSGGQRAVSGKVVEGESDARMGAGGRMRGRTGGRRLGVGDGGREEERCNCERAFEQAGEGVTWDVEGKHEGSPGRKE